MLKYISITISFSPAHGTRALIILFSPTGISFIRAFVFPWWRSGQRMHKVCEYTSLSEIELHFSRTYVNRLIAE